MSSHVFIGVPTYNRPRGLRATLEDLVAQDYHDWEILVSDNASTDEDVEACARTFAARDTRIRYVRQQNNIGIQGNFQFLLESAVGEYFMWAADDDRHDRSFLRRMVQLLRENPSAVVAASHFSDYLDDRLEASASPAHLGVLHSLGAASAGRRSAAFILAGAGKSHPIYGLYRRTVAQGGPPLSDLPLYGLDTLFVFATLQRGSVAVCDDVLFKSGVGNEKLYAAKRESSLAGRLRAHFRAYVLELLLTGQYLRWAEPKSLPMVLVALPLYWIIVTLRFVRSLMLALSRLVVRRKLS